MENKTNESHQDTGFTKKFKAIIKYVVGGVLLLWLANFVLIWCDKRSDIGDMFGVVNALFSGLAFGGIILTIYLQSDELRQQREELSLTRNEFKKQNETLILQRFENTFFNLLSIHHQIVNSMDYEYRSANKLVKGRDVFKITYTTKLRSNMGNKYVSIDSLYKPVYKDTHTDFGHYFRNLYRIIKLVDTTQFLHVKGELNVFKTKYKYTSMLRAQLSDYELLWLFYNCLSEFGIEKFKPYVEQYALLKNLPKDEIPNQDHLTFYKESAFNPIFE